jgi:hypothetical protein
VTARDIHAAETAGYVRDLLAELYRSEKTRVLIYSRQPYAAALESIATERATALELLRDAVGDGLLERLAAEKSDKDVAAAVEAGLFEQPAPAQAAAYRRQLNEDESAESTAHSGLGGAWEDPAVRRAVRETIADGGAR